VGEAWKEVAFLATAKRVPKTIRLFPWNTLQRDPLQMNSEVPFQEISCWFKFSYVLAFLFLGANLGNIKCGTGSRWTMALGALFVVR